MIKSYILFQKLKLLGNNEFNLLTIILTSPKEEIYMLINSDKNE